MNETIEDQVTNAVTHDLTASYGEEHMVTSWVLVAEVLGPDGEPTPYILTSPDISSVQTFGLLEAGRLMFQADFRSSDE